MNHNGNANKMVGEDHLPDTGKMVSDTPSTDSCLTAILDADGYVDQRNCPKLWVSHSRELERELNAANDRIKRLEEAGDKMASAWDKEWLTEADIEAIIDDWHGAKGNKP